MTKKVNIYCPTYHRFEKTKYSILSIIESVGFSSNDVHLYIVDNDSPEEMREWLAVHSCDNVTVELLKENIGKGSAVNKMHEQARGADYIISVDSDLINKREINWIDMFVEVMETDDRWGLIACDFQEGLNVHLVKTLKEKTTVGKYTIKHGSRGIGGCALIMKHNDFTKIGGYTNPDIYNGDDGFLIQSVVVHLQKKAGICEQAILYHPHPNEGLESEYQKWKFDKCHRVIPWNKTPNTGFYENQ